MDDLRILIISRTPWNNTNSFGNTFSNLFGNMAGVRIFNICCQAGVPYNTIVEDTWQMTDLSVLKSICGGTPGWRLQQSVLADWSANQIKIKTKRITAAYLIREVIWKLGRWCNNDFKKFIKAVNPDVIYLPLYRSGYMCDVQKRVIEQVNCPVVCHISDDIYSLPVAGWFSPFKTLYYKWMRYKIKYLISKSEYGEVFAENMAEEYGQLFNKTFYLIGKGVNRDKIVPNNIWVKEAPIKFVYTGNYGGERGLQLLNIATSIARYFKEEEAELRIYSSTSPDAGINKRLLNTHRVRLCGSLGPEDIRSVQQGADFLVHVEGFDPVSIAETRMSFSTKLIDYMLAQRPIIAVGPSNINSIRVLKNEGMALVANSLLELDKLIEKISTSSVSSAEVIAHANQYLFNQRDREIIQNGIYSRLISLSTHESKDKRNCPCIQS